MRRTTPERRTSKARRCSGTTARSEGRATRTKRDVIFTVPATLLPLQLRIGDRVVNAEGAWEIINGPWSMASRKTV